MAKRTRRKTKPPIRRRRKRYKINYPRLIISVLVLALIVELSSVIFTSPYFYIRHREVKGNSIISDKVIIDTLRLPANTNIFRVKKKSLADKLRKIPPIEEVRIGRRLPNTLKIWIKERKPFFILNANSKLYEVDSKGIPFRIVNAPTSKIPVITCNLSKRVILGVKPVSTYFDNAMKCLVLVQERESLQVSKIAVDQTGDLCLNERSGFKVVLGRQENLPEKLDIVVRILEQNPSFKQHGEYIDVTCPEAPAFK